MGNRRRIGTWPLFVIAIPAGVAVWSGWVGLGQLTGFGVVHPLPGIADKVTLNTAITLPIGVEAYAAYAMRVWFAGSGIPRVARRYAAVSAIVSLLIGIAGQVSYHLMQAAGVGKAPWGITMAVACLPVVTFGMAMALAHLLNSGGRDDQAPADDARQEAEESGRTSSEPVVFAPVIAAADPGQPMVADEVPPALDASVSGQFDPDSDPGQPRSGNAVIVRQAHRQNPAASHAELARLTGLSAATVKRYRPPVTRVNGSPVSVSSGPEVTP